MNDLSLFKPIVLNEEMRMDYKPFIKLGSYSLAGLFTLSFILMCFIFRDPTVYCECLTNTQEITRKRKLLKKRGLKLPDYLDIKTQKENEKVSNQNLISQ